MKKNLTALSPFSVLAYVFVSMNAACPSISLAAENSLEEEMFGGEKKTPAAGEVAAPAASGPAAAAAPLQENALVKSNSLGEMLTLGGRLSIDTTIIKNKDQKFADSPLLSSTAAELYLDARPSDNVRGFIRGSLSNRAGAQTVPIFSVYETWVKWGGSGALFTTLGKQKLKWGAATFWNPTDFLSVQPKDPLADFDVRPGANLLKLHVPFEKSGHNLYAIVSMENTSAAHDPKIAARAEINYGTRYLTGELTATVAGGRKQPQQFGLDLNTSLGVVDLIAEAAWTKKSQRQFYKTTTGADGSRTVTNYSRENETVAQVVTGLRYDLKYSESDSANLSVEYFWNDFGSSNVISEAASFVRGQAQRLYLANRYMGANLVFVQPGPLNDSTLLISGLWNMTDNSWLARAGWTEKLDMKSNLIFALTRTGGVGEFTGGIPASVAGAIRKSQITPEVSAGLEQLEGRSQEWLLSLSANLNL
jgi:hypothetical protein